MENNDENAFYFEDSPQSPTHSTTVTISSSPKQIKNRAELIIKCFKWKHSFKKALYNEFFDYESKDFNIYEFKASGYRGTLTDHFTHVTYEPDEENTVNDILRFDNQKEFIKTNITFTMNKDSNYIIHTNPHCFISTKYISPDSELLHIQGGTILKIGKYSLHIKMVKKNDGVHIDKSDKAFYQFNDDSSDNTEEKTCKICLRNNTDIPFISVCKCKGSLKYAHSECLFRWIQKKSEVTYEYKNPFYYVLRINKFFCEICKAPYPFGVYIKDTYFYLLDGLEKFNTFLISTLRYHNEKNELNKINNEYILLNLSNYYKNEIVIGRGRDSILHLNNVSVSREHCVISYDKENDIVKVIDKGSKFGTLIQNINQIANITLSNSNPNITIQKGNTVYNFNYCLI